MKRTYEEWIEIYRFNCKKLGIKAVDPDIEEFLLRRPKGDEHNP